MDNSFRKTVEIDSSNEIESVIENWASKHGFKHDNSASLPNIDNMAYSFSFVDKGLKTLVLINILDNKVYLETMTVKDSFQSELSKTAIEDLLDQF